MAKNLERQTPELRRLGGGGSRTFGGGTTEVRDALGAQLRQIGCEVFLKGNYSSNPIGQ